MTQSEQPGQSEPETPNPSGTESGGNLVGRTLDDYQVERLLGRGGMGEVYLARQVSLDRPVALKVLRPDLPTQSTTALGRFEAEAWSAARLSHPNIVHIYAVGRVGDLRYIAMEYVPGTDLGQLLARKGPPELIPALSIIRQAGEAIRAAGEAGLLHRDLKPENLLLTREGLVKVADFGLCRNLSDGRGPLSQTGVVLGTPLYMSPEQIRGLDLDHRSDLYSLGVTCYHLLSGVPPFQADSALALGIKHLHDDPEPLTSIRPDLPPELDRLVRRLLAKDPADRYPSAAEMLADLATLEEQVLTGGSRPAPVGSGTGRSSWFAPLTANLSVPNGPAPASGRGGWLRLGAGAAAVVVFGLSLGAAWGWSGRWQEPPDLPAATAPAGLWIVPAWDRVPIQRDARTQYRYAQLLADESGREAAWLAVPGRFPGDVSWGREAYAQLTRELLTHRDASRLAALAADLERSKAFRDPALVALTRAAAAAIRDDPRGVLEQLRLLGDLRFLEPPLAELGLEVILQTRRDTWRAEPEFLPLSRLQDDLLQVLKLNRADLTGRDTPS